MRTERAADRQTKFILVSFDGLRPDLVSQELTPNLIRLGDAGVRFLNHRTVFPSESMVAYASLVTGAPPAGHGITTNIYIDRNVYAERAVDTARVEDFEAASKAYSGRLLTAPTLGEVLRQADRHLAVLSGNSPGCTRLIDHTGIANGGFSFCFPHPGSSYPRETTDEIFASLGILPATPTRPGQGSKYLTDVFLDHVWPLQQPDVTIIVFDEPDSSFHQFGLGSRESLDAIHQADEQLGRIMDLWETEPHIQLIALSDHGHISQRQRASARNALEVAGLPISSGFGSDRAIQLLPGHVGKIYLADRDAATLDRIVDVLSSEPWCGMLIARDELSPIDAIKMGAALANHPRAPDLYYTLRADNSVNRFGIQGVVFADDDAFFDGAGYHGGLHEAETSCLAIAAGSHFKRGHRSSFFSGIIDIAPTILSVLGLTAPSSMSGRVLREALAGAGTVENRVTVDEIVGARGSYRQVLKRVQVDGTRYIDFGLVE